MFYKCTSCQAEHEPPRLPLSNILTHCPIPNCGQPVTLIQHDTEPPPRLLDQADDDNAGAGVVRTHCRSCGGPYHYGEDGTLLSIDHAPKCDRRQAGADTDPEFEAASVVEGPGTE
jgi:hypothetical protein